MADALSRIRNAYFRSFQDVIVVDSKEIRELLNALIHAGYINNWCCANATGPAAKPRQGTVEGGVCVVGNGRATNGPVCVHWIVW